MYNINHCCLIIALFILSSCSHQSSNNDAELVAAMKSNNPEKFKMVLDKGIKNGQQSAEFNQIAFFEACKSADILTAKDILDKGIDPNGEGFLGKMALHYAIESGNLKIVEFLLEKGSNINGGSSFISPLSYACLHGKEEIALFLLNKGANINKEDSDGTPLFYATRQGLKRVVKLLIQKGANVNIQNEDGNTPLHIVAISLAWTNIDSKKLLAISDMLLENGANPRIANNYGKTCLDLIKPLRN